MAVNPNSQSLFFQNGQNSWLLGYEAYDHGNPIEDPFNLSDKDKVIWGHLESLGQELDGVEAIAFGCSRGLVCLQAYDGDSIFIYNPTLHEYKRIPALPAPFKKWVIFLHGFGYVSLVGDYKIVLGLKDPSDDESEPVMGVFSLKNYRWSLIGDDRLRILSECKLVRKGILVNDHLHWWIRPIHGNNNDGRIFAFDMLYEVFAEIPIPEELFPIVRTFEPSINTGISEIGERLCLFICQHDNVKLWMLKQYGNIESWEEHYNFNNKEGNQYHFSEFFGLTRTGKILILGWDTYYECNVFLVDPSQLNPKLIRIGNLGCSNNGLLNSVEGGVNYVESHVSPLGFGRPMEERGLGHYIRPILVFVATVLLLWILFLFV